MKQSHEESFGPIQLLVVSWIPLDLASEVWYPKAENGATTFRLIQGQGTPAHAHWRVAEKDPLGSDT
jgi:hypothetical protein